MGKLSKKTKMMITFLIIIILGLLGVIVYLNMDKIMKEEKNECSDEVDEKLCQVNTFEFDESDSNNAHGKVRVTGYATIKEVPEEECFEDECDSVAKVKYVSFIVTKTDSKEFKDYLETLNGNSFADNSSIGLGCYKNNKISYTNNSVYFGDKDFELNDKVTESIIKSTKSSPVTLDLEKLELGEAKGAPACYSHMTYIKLAK